MLSSAAGDGAGKTITIDYIGTDGVLATESKDLNGTTPVDFVATMDAILRIRQSAGANHAGIVTIRKDGAGSTIATMEITPFVILDVRRPFYNAIANPTGGVTKTYYEKVFIRNNNAVSSISDSTVIEQLDVNAVVDFALETVLGGTTDNGVGNNRQVSPAGFVFDSTTKNVANGKVLSAASAQGMWMKLTLAGGQSPADTTWTVRLQGIAA
jgi:hypothetical protein